MPRNPEPSPGKPPSAGSSSEGPLTSRTEWSLGELADSLFEVVWIANPETRRLLCASPGYSAWAGAPLDPLCATLETLTSRAHPDDRGRVEAARTPHCTGPYAVEYRIVGTDGHVRWMRERAVPLRNPEGDVECLLGTVEDITERKAEEARLARCETRYGRMAQGTHDAIWEWDLATNRFCWTHASAAWASPPPTDGALSIDDWYRLIHPEDRERVAQSLLKAVRTADGTWIDEFRWMRPDGSPAYVLARGYVERGADGAPSIVFGGMVDITENQQAEEQLRLSEERFRCLVSLMPAAVYTCDREGRITFYNRRAVELWGREPRRDDPEEKFCGSERIYRLDGSPLPHDQTPTARAIFEGLSAHNEEVIIERPDGTRIVASVNVEPLEDADGRRSGAINVFQDITARRRMEEELRAWNQRLEARVQQRTADLVASQEALRRAERLAAIGQMMTGLSHESRNALQRSLACLEMLDRKLRNEPALLALVSEARKAQLHLQRIYQEVKSYAGPIKLEPALQNVASCWREAWEALAPQREGRDIRLVEQTEGVDLQCWSDRQQLCQAFRNILDNSLSACDDPVEIDIQCTPATRQGAEALAISIRDNGPGLSEEQTRRIFEPFYTTKTKGTGLGMAVVQRILEAHGGAVSIAPRPGRGLEIELTLPRSAPLSAAAPEAG